MSTIDQKTEKAPATGMMRYWLVLLTFIRNSLVRDLSFRTNFVLQSISSMSWTVMNFGFFKIIFSHTSSIGRDTGWGEHEFFVFLSTTWIVNSIVQAFFMPNAEEFSEMIRKGNLDFALLKPIDTQFLISFPKVAWPSLANLVMGIVLLIYSLMQLSNQSENPLVIPWWSPLVYIFYIGCGIGILYSVMIAMASTSIWLGRNQNLYTFWFYITNFYRQPMEIYQRGFGWGLWGVFTFAIPILVVANIPARILAQPLRPGWQWWEWGLAIFTVAATCFSLVLSRWVFKKALLGYRSASS